MKTKVGINGFGRIGRQVLKAIMERSPATSWKLSQSTTSLMLKPMRICLSTTLTLASSLVP